MFKVFNEARHDASHSEHAVAKVAGYVAWDHNEIHSEVIAEEFLELQMRKTRRAS